MNHVDRTAEEFPKDMVGKVSFSPKKILLATDGSAPSVKATKYAVALAVAAGASLTAVFVDTGESALLYPEERLEADVASGVHQSEAGTKLARAFCEANGIECEIKVLRGGVAPQIVKFAESGGFDLIVMGDMGRTGLARLALGSVAEAVVKAAHTEVLVVKR